MKRLFILTIIILSNYIGISQTVPIWTKKLPNPSNNTFYYCSITGLGGDYNEALNDAYNKLHRIIDEKLGTTIIGKSSIDNQGAVSYYAIDGQTHTIKTFKACEWPKPYEKSDHWEFLFQVAEAGNITVKFDVFSDCYDGVDWNKYALKMDKEKKKKKRENDSFIQNGYNKYFSFALGNGMSYGGANIIGFAASNRFGGRFGIEPHIGLGWSRKKFNAISGGYSGHIRDYSKNTICYSIGINIFVFKGFYISANYGSNELFVVDHYYDDYEIRYLNYMSYYDGYESAYHNRHKYEEYVYHIVYGHDYSSGELDKEARERFDLDYYKGMSFLAGYKYYFGYEMIGARGYLDFGAGVKCYSETDTSLGFEKFDFAWSIGIGLAF